MISVMTTTLNNTTDMEDEELSFIKLSGTGDPIANDLLEITTVNKGVDIFNDINEIDADVKINDIMEEIVNEARKNIPESPKIRIVNALRVINPPLSTKEELDGNNLETLECIDPDITAKLGAAPKNYLMESYLLGLFNGYINILEKERLSGELLQQLKDLRDIAMRKDKVAAVQKWDVIIYNITKYEIPQNQQDAYADLKAIMKVFKKIFFTDLNLY